ncbi:LOW QUALITY PROTEIN: mucin-5AC-like [Penaeus chinensis]|uniref:LOW QUALITY PROTEIN: mucin-5AC-like n=1 Tax=Penaeus chinensis TaxID=139456 RepID=UPI001FB5FEC3|nr:LOW QUALITY PROTEIN: mucin-5AC-like [Penaeus chinensis]
MTSHSRGRRRRSYSRTVISLSHCITPTARGCSRSEASGVRMGVLCEGGRGRRAGAISEGREKLEALCQPVALSASTNRACAVSETTPLARRPLGSRDSLSQHAGERARCPLGMKGKRARESESTLHGRRRTVSRIQYHVERPVYGGQVDGAPVVVRGPGGSPEQVVRPGGAGPCSWLWGEVRAHRDDWEAERSEKRAAQTSLAEAEARTALLLQELQLLQAKLADTESKRGLCWRCLLPRTDFSNRSSRCSSASTSAQASPVPAPNPPGAPSAPPVSAAPNEPPPAPLKGWIPVSMLHQIAFSGATPEHQTPVVHAQPRAQPSSRPQTQGHHHPASSSKSTPGGQASLGKAADKTPAAQKQEPPAPHVGSLKQEESRGSSTAGSAPSAESKTGGVGGVADEKKKYEAMGARPKVLGNLQPLAGKGVGLIEDEKSAKHRARSILASAIPVSPVSSGPPTPCGPSLTRSPSTPNMPKGYMPITSTILTPINFRQPFVAHKRPSTMKQITQAVHAASQASSSARARSETSPSGAAVRADPSSAQSPPVGSLSSALAQPHGEALLPAHTRSDSSPAAIGLSFPAGGGGTSQAPDGEAPGASGKGEGGVSAPASGNAQSGVEDAPSGSSKDENSGGKEAASPAKGSTASAAASDNVQKPQLATSSTAADSSKLTANNHASKSSSSSSPPKTAVTSDSTKVTTTSNSTNGPSSAAKTASSNATVAPSTHAKAAASTSTKTAASNNTKVTTSNNSTVTTSSNTTGVTSKIQQSLLTALQHQRQSPQPPQETLQLQLLAKSQPLVPSRTTTVTNSQNTSAATSRSISGTSTVVAAVPSKTATVNSSKAGASTKNTATKTATSSSPSSAGDNTAVSSAKASAGTANKAGTTSAGAANPSSAGPAAAPNASAANGLPKNGAASASSTAFASITVTTTAAGTVGAHPTSSASTYSSATSSRSSSPGMSLTTFGLNSEGRGIPGAIFFALRPEQNGIRSPQPCPSSRGTSASSVKSPTPDSVAAGQTYRQALPPSGVKSPPILEHPATNVVKEEHWWSVESPGRSSTPGRQQGGKLVNSTWVRLMGGQANNRQSSGLPWRTARAVSGQQLDQARRASHEDSTSGPTSPNSMSSTATFNYTPAVNSPPSSNLSSATNSAATSPLPAVNQRPCEDLRSMASKNISSAIMSYELGNKCEPLGSPVGVGTPGWPGQGLDAPKAAPANDGVATMTRRDLVCPSCQMLFPPEKHLQFLDHFEVCRGPEYADL